MATKADSEPIRLSPERLQNLKDRMRAISGETVPTSGEIVSTFSEMDFSEQIRLHYEARVAARSIIHEHLAYGLDRGEAWGLALDVLSRPFEYHEYEYEDQLGNSMLGIDRFIRR